MNNQEAFKRFARQVQKASQGGGAPKGLFAGGGFIVALVAGGLALNASLFNGELRNLLLSGTFLHISS